MDRRSFLVSAVNDMLAFRVPATSLSLFISFCAAVYGIWAGLTIIFSQPIRFKNPVYHIMDGHAPIWGIFVTGCGLLVLGGLIHRRFRLKAIGLIGLSAWSAIFAFSSFKAMIEIPEAASTPPPVYLFVAVTLAALVWMDEKRLTYANTETCDRR